MIIKSYNGYDLPGNGYQCGVDWLWGQWQVLHNEEQRLNAPALLSGGTVSTRAIPVTFAYRADLDPSADLTFEDAMLRLMARLNPLDTTARALVAELNDGTDISCLAVVQVTGASTDDDDANWIECTFLTADPYWTETADTTHNEPGIQAGANATFTVTNNGATDVYPVIERSNNSAFIFAYADRRRITLTNSGDLPLERETMLLPVPYSIGFTGAGGAMLKDGTFYPLTKLTTDIGLDNWFAFPASVEAGESEVFDLLGGPASLPTGEDLDTYSRFDGNYSALDIGMQFVLNATGATGTTISDSGESWTVDRWKGACILIVSGTGAGQARIITGNTATTITVGRAWSTNPDTTSDFVLIGSVWFLDGGKASSATATVLTDSSQAFYIDSLIGGTIYLTGGTGSGQSRTILDNTATTITTAAFSPTPDSTTTYRVERYGYHRYYVEQTKHSENHRGGWQQNKRFTRPSKVLWGSDVLNAWEPFLLHENGDDYNQSRTCPVDVGGGDVDYFPILDADRRKGQDRKLQEEGQADGVSVYHPFGYSNLIYDDQLKNPNSAAGATKGICKAVVAGREAGGDEFEIYAEDDTLRTTLTASSLKSINLTEFGSPEQLYMGLLPQDEVEVSRDALDNDTATYRWYTRLRMFLDIAGKFSYSIGSLETVIPIEDEIRIGDYALQIGMRDGQRLFCLQTDSLFLDCANARAWLDDGVTETDVTYAVTPVVYDSNGNYQVADRWPPLAPGNNTVVCSGSPWATAGGFDLSLEWRERHFG